MLLFRDHLKKIFFSSLLFWLHWFSLVASTGYSSSWCVSFALQGLLCGVQALDLQASVVAAHGLLSCGSAGPRMWVQKLWCMTTVVLHVGTHVLCISRKILKHCTTREVLFFFFFFAASQDLWDLSSLPWIEPGTPAVKALLTTGSPGNSQVRTTLIRHFTVVVQFNP